MFNNLRSILWKNNDLSSGNRLNNNMGESLFYCY